jgi:hypothetical protein
VFTDNGSKDLKLKEEILRIKKKKELEVYIVLTPDYEGRPNDESLKVKRTNKKNLEFRHTIKEIDRQIKYQFV